MSRIFLVDTENVGLGAIANAKNLCEDEMVILFLTTRTQHQFSTAKLNVLDIKAKIVKVLVDTGTKNSLDFQLVSYLGFMLGEHKNQNNSYYIVSKDKGYLSSVNLLINCSKQHIELIDKVLSENKDLDFLLDALINKFREQGFRKRTAAKMALLTLSSSTYEDAVENFNRIFCRNSNAILYSKDVLAMYFNKEVI